MNGFRCYDAATVITDEATRRFSPSKRESAILKKVFKEHCGIIDRLATRFGGSKAEIEIDENTTDIIIKLDCIDPEIQDSRDEFYKLVGSAKTAFFEPSKCIEDGVVIGFVLDGFWVDA